MDPSARDQDRNGAGKWLIWGGRKVQSHTSGIERESQFYSLGFSFPPTKIAQQHPGVQSVQLSIPEDICGRKSGASRQTVDCEPNVAL